MTFSDLWRSLLPLGRDEASGGYRRYAWTPADRACRDWFVSAADARGLRVEADRCGNLCAWWGEPGPGAVVTGSHLDSVPDGGAFDGPLGVVSALAAVERLQAEGVRPERPVAVTVWADEEGARFGVACAGSRLATGLAEPARLVALRDADGVTMAEAMRAAGTDPDRVGREEWLGLVGTVVELHVEQGRGLVDLDAPVGVATGVWPHGRWRLQADGEANHAGTTRLADRRDPLLTVADTVLRARHDAGRLGGVATFGKVQVVPGGVNAVPSGVTAWLDARAPDEATLRELLEAVQLGTAERAARDGTAVSWAEESWTPAVGFDPATRELLQRVLGGVPELATGAGHDAAVLATAGVPAAMLFVRNPTGASHTPAEHADEVDCAAGVEALTGVLRDLVATP